MSLARAETAMAQDHSNGQAAACAASALAALGEGERAREWVARALRIDPDDRAMRYNLACALVLDLGDADGALQLLAPYLATATRAEIVHARVDPDLDAARADPRFEALLAEAAARLDAAGAP